MYTGTYDNKTDALAELKEKIRKLQEEVRELREEVAKLRGVRSWGDYTGASA